MSKELLLKQIAQYILDTEEEDYQEWCIDWGYNPMEYEHNKRHVYAKAKLALKGEIDE